jgi:hypothetical protein
MRIHRKILFGAAAVLLPVSTVALVGATSGVASATGAIECSVAAEVTFATPGLSASGAESTSKSSVTTTTAPTIGNIENCGGSSSVGALTITTKSTKCTGAGLPASNPACTAKHQYGYDSWANYESSGTSGIAKSLKHLTATVDGVLYAFKISGAAATTCHPTAGPQAGDTEVGFAITGSVKSPKTAKGDSLTLTACLGSDSGPGTTGTFDGDFGHGGLTVQKASVDGSAGASTLVIG